MGIDLATGMAERTAAVIAVVPAESCASLQACRKIGRWRGACSKRQLDRGDLRLDSAPSVSDLNLAEAQGRNRPSSPTASSMRRVLAET